jgi:hypothetical protein
MMNQTMHISVRIDNNLGASGTEYRIDNIEDKDYFEFVSQLNDLVENYRKKILLSKNK